MIEKWGLRGKIQITITAVVVFLTLILMLLMTYFIGSLANSMLLKIMPSMAKITAQGVEGHLHTLAGRVFLLRENPVLTNPLSPDSEKLAVLNNALEGIEFGWAGLYTRQSGQLVLGSKTAPDSIYGLKMFFLTRQTRNLVIGDTIVRNSEPEINMGVPVMDERGTVLYILAASYKYDVLSDALRNINISASSSAFIVNAKGELQSHGNIQHILNGDTIYRIFDRKPAEELISQVMLGNTGSFVIRNSSPVNFLLSLFALGEGPRFISCAPIRGSRWSLVIEVPSGDFSFAARQAVIISVIVTLLLLGVFSVVFNFFLKRVLTEPLRLLTLSARRLARGRFSSRLPGAVFGHKDEINLLAQAYVTLANSIQSVIVDIDRITWAARTGSLDRRSPLSYHQGDYYRIAAGVNTTLDVINAQLDTIPDALALLGESREFRYRNKAMTAFLERFKLDPAGGGALAYICSSGKSRDYTGEIDAVFDAEKKDAGTYTAEIVLAEGENEYNYVMTLCRTAAAPGADSGADGGKVPVCVMLILSDVTQLTRAKTSAETANRAKSDFLSRMSHEMRTPMNAIIGMTHIAKTSRDPERKDYCLEKVDEASKHLLGVINDILDMSKIEADKLELSPVEFNFEKMIMKVTDVIIFRIDEKKQNFAVHLDPRIPPVLTGDAQRLAQILTNLLSNAVKFTPEQGTIRLEVALEKTEGRLCTIRISVTDTGIGITEEQKSRLFNPFEQADGGISRKFGGTGLGLAISRRLVEMMGGAIRIESRPGAGSSFIFTIKAEQALEPRAAASPDSSDAGSAAADNGNTPAGGAGKDAFKGYRIILAEDVELNREIVLALLEDTGLTIDCAENGAAALNLFSENPGRYDLIFMDVHMPEMDGFEATRRIRALDNPRGASIPIIAMTANVFREDIERCLEAGMNDHIGKPLDIAVVLEKLRKYLREQSR
jgi:signal transduction histidine kinase